MIFRYKPLFLAVSVERDELRQQLEVERAKRINAEVLASERLKEIARVEERAMRFEQQYVDATSARMKSLDFVNAGLMREMAPEVESNIKTPMARTEIKTRPITLGARLKHDAIKQGIQTQAIPKKAVN